MANGDEEKGLVDHHPFQKLREHAERVKKGVNERPFICNVPRVLRDVDEKSFTPMLVSIGPLHKHNVNLDPQLQRLKYYCLSHLFPSDHDDDDDHRDDHRLKACWENVKASMDRIKSYYEAGLINHDQLDAGELANMMLLDGCFILEFCIDHHEKDHKPTFPNNSQNLCIARDLILLENQIPFFVLEEIFKCTRASDRIIGKSYTSLAHLLHWVMSFYFKPINNSFDHLVCHKKNPEIVHILDCLHKCYHLPDAVNTNNTPETCCLRVVKWCEPGKKKKETVAVHSVVELERSGVNFESHQDKGMVMKFKPSPFSCFSWSWSKPSFVMPKLVIEDFSEVILRNFIAYEQSFPDKASNYFSSYAYGMDKLIDSQADVGKLVELKVLVNNLGSNKDAADMINGITKNLVLGESSDHYAKEMEKLDEYYNGKWPNYIATLRRTYFNSPWNFIALLAGITLFVLTVVQTIFTVMSYNP